MSKELTGLGLKIFDADDAGSNATAILSCSHGEIHVAAGTSSVTPTNNDSAAVTLTGTIAHLDAFFKGETTGTATYHPDAGLNLNLLARYKFEEGYGTSAADSSSAGTYTGTLTNGATWIAGHTGNFAVDLDGTNDYVSLSGIPAALGTGAALTIAGWVKPDSTGGTAVQRILGAFSSSSLRVEMGTGGSGVGSQTGVRIAFGTPTAVTAGSILADAVWHHWAMVFDGSQSTNATKLKFYLDGVAQTLTFSATIGTTIPDVSAGTARIGISSASGPFDGKVDDFRIYQRALSSTEIGRLVTPYSGSVTFTLAVTDADSLTNTVTFDGTVSNFLQPVVTMPSATLTAAVGTSLTLQGLTAFDVTDTDDDGDFVTGRIRNLSGGGGTITVVPGNSGVEVTSGNSSSDVRLTGTIAAFHNLVTGAGTGTIKADFVTFGSYTLQMDITDSNQQTGSNTKTITAYHAPVVSAPGAALTVATNTDLNIHGAGFLYTDVDASGTQSMALSVLPTTNSTITVAAGNSGVTVVSGSGGVGPVTITGTLAQLNNLLQATGTGTIKYKRTAGTGTHTFTVTITDDTSHAGANSISIAVGAATWTGYAEATPTVTSQTIDGFIGVVDLSRMPASWWASVMTDGRDIRAVKFISAAETQIPSHVLHFDYTNQKGVLLCAFQNATTPPTIRIYAGASNASALSTGATYGQYAVYSSFIKAFWPDGGGGIGDVTTNVNTPVMENTSVGAIGSVPFGFATRYDTSTNSIGTISNGNVGTDIPETLVTFASPDGVNTLRYAMATTHGTVYNILGHENSKVKAITGIVSGSLKKASATGNITANSWQLFAAAFLATNDRLAYRAGDNKGEDTSNLTGIASVNSYVLGGAAANSGGYQKIPNYNGWLSLSFIFGSGITQAKIESWLANYAGLFDQATYWGVWAWTTSAQTGL